MIYIIYTPRAGDTSRCKEFRTPVEAELHLNEHFPNSHPDQLFIFCGNRMGFTEKQTTTTRIVLKETL